MSDPPQWTDIGALYRALDDIAGNVAFVEGELPKVALRATDRAAVLDRMREFDGAIHDVRTEIRNLEDKLGLHPGEPPQDPDIANPDPRATMRLIRNWRWTEIEALDPLVRRLQATAKVDIAFGLASLLVGESATNILNAFNAVEAALAHIEATRA